MFVNSVCITRMRSLTALVVVISLMGGFKEVQPTQHLAATAVPGCIQPLSRPVAWYPLDERNGTIARDLMNNFTGNYNGNPKQVPAKVDWGLEFDGMDDHVVIPNNPFLHPTDIFSMAAWVWVDNFTDSPMDIVSKDAEGAGPPREYLLGITKAGADYYFLGFVGVGEATIGQTPLQEHTWYHVAMVFDIDTLLLYVNGEPDGFTGPILSNLLPSDEPVRIGGGAPAGQPPYYFNGIIDEVEIYDSYLSSAEIKAIYDAGSAGKCKCLEPAAGLVSWWPGDGQGQEPAVDLVGKNHGQLIGNATYDPNGRVGGSPAFRFDGDGDLVEIANAPSLNPSNALSLNAWVWVEALPTTYMDIIGKDPEAGAARQYFLNIAREEEACYFRANLTTGTGGVHYINGTTAVQVNRWYHIAMTYDGAFLRLYVNGQLETSHGMTGAIPATSVPFRIGGGASPGLPQYFFNGLIDEVQLRNVALSADDIQAMYLAGGMGECKARCRIYLPVVQR